jgi:hypothetical protein
VEVTVVKEHGGDDGDEAIYGGDDGDEAKIQVRPDDGARRWNLAM